jgi:hypothetical protein
MADVVSSRINSVAVDADNFDMDLITLDGGTLTTFLKLDSANSRLRASVDLLLDTTENIYFRDTALSINSADDGHLDITADTSIDLNADVEAADDVSLLSDAAVLNFGADSDVSLTHVADTGLLLNSAMQLQFRDSAIGIYSQADTFLDLFADGGVRIGDSSAGAPTNYLHVQPDGEIQLVGTAKYKKYVHLEFDHTRTTGTAKPTEVIRGAISGFSLPIYAADDEELFSCTCIDPAWDGTTDPVVKLAVWLASAEDVNDDFNLQVSVEVFNPSTNEVVPTTTNDYAVETNVTVGTQYASYFVSFTLDADVIGMVAGEPMSIRIRRLAAAGTEIAGEVVVHGVVIEWTCNKLGQAT